MSSDLKSMYFLRISRIWFGTIHYQRLTVLTLDSIEGLDHLSLVAQMLFLLFVADDSLVGPHSTLDESARLKRPFEPNLELLLPERKFPGVLLIALLDDVLGFREIEGVLTWLTPTLKGSCGLGSKPI